VPASGAQQKGDFKMAFCPNCGATVEGRFCAKCGTQVNATAAPETGPANAAYATPAATGLSDNVAGALCYVLGLITGILFLVLAPYNQSKFVRFHAFQSIFLHVGLIALWVIDTTIVLILPWSLHLIVSLLWMLIALGGVAMWLICLVKAYQGERYKLPVIGDLAEKQA